MIITIDGYCCQGKSSVAKRLAKELEWEFFSIGTAFRYLAIVFNQLQVEDNNSGLKTHQIADKAIEIMHRTSIHEMGNSSCMKARDTERALQILTGYPVVHEQIAKKILDSYGDRNTVLDGRIGFQLFPRAHRNYYFKTSIEKRAYFASKSRNLSYEAAIEYIMFRDSFEQRYDIPMYVRIVELDNFSTIEEIISYLKCDIT